MYDVCLEGRDGSRLLITLVFRHAFISSAGEASVTVLCKPH